MSFGEDIIKLRQKIAEAMSKGLVGNGDDKNFLEATLIQILNDAERNRQSYTAQAENFRRQIALAEGQANAYASISSIVFNILQGFIIAHDRTEEEEQRLAAEKTEKIESEKENNNIIINESEIQDNKQEEVKIKEDIKRKKHK